MQNEANVNLGYPPYSAFESACGDKYKNEPKGAVPRVAPSLATGLPDLEEEEMQNEPNVILGILTLTPFFLRASLVPSCPS
jgi:hypothetical protein